MGFFETGIFAIACLAMLGLAGVIPWLLAAVDRDLVNLLLLWFLAALFSLAPDGNRLVLPMLLKISWYQLILALLVTSFASQLFIGQRLRMNITKIEVAMAVLLIFAGLSQYQAGLLEAKGQGLKIANLFNQLFFPFVIFFLSKHLIDTEGKRDRVFLVLLAVGAYLAVTAVGEMVPQLSGMVFPGYIMDPEQGIHFGRARGPFLNAAVNGTVMAMILPLGLHLALNAKLTKGLRRFAWAATALLPVGLYLTHTRACWLGGVLSALVLAAFIPKVRKLFALAALACMLVVAVQWATTGEDENRLKEMDPIYARMHVYNASWRMLAANPFLGVGYDNFSVLSPRYFTSIKGIPYNGFTLVSHDTFLGLLVELGFIGFLPMAFIYLALFRSSWRLYRQQRPAADVGWKYTVVIFWGAGVVFLTNMQFIDMRYFIFPNALFFMLAGIIIGFEQRLPGLLSRAPATPASKPIFLDVAP
jgi:hypothetical protein